MNSLLFSIALIHIATNCPILRAEKEKNVSQKTECGLVQI